MSYIARIRKMAFVQGVLVIAGGSAIAQVLPLLLTPLLSRLYSPEVMGTLALFTAFVGLASPQGSLQYSKAIVSAQHEEDAKSLGALSLLLILPTSLFGCIVLWLLVSSSQLGYGALPIGAIPVMFLVLIARPLFMTLRFWQLRVGGFAPISIATVWQSCGRIVTQVVLGFIQLGWLGLVLGEAIGNSLGLRALANRSSSLFAWFQTEDLPRKILGVAKDYRKFPLLSSPSMLLNSISLALPAPLISSGFGVVEAGQFAMATRIMLIPMVLVGTAVGDVFHNRLALHARQHPNKAKPFFFRVTAGLLLLGALPALIVSHFGPTLWVIVLGDQWVLSGLIAQSIIPWVLVQFVVSPVSQAVAVYQRQELKLIYDILAAVSVVGVLVIGPKLNWSITDTCSVLGWTQAFVYVVYFVLLSRTIDSRNLSERFPKISST